MFETWQRNIIVELSTRTMTLLLLRCCFNPMVKVECGQFTSCHFHSCSTKPTGRSTTDVKCHLELRGMHPSINVARHASIRQRGQCSHATTCQACRVFGPHCSDVFFCCNLEPTSYDDRARPFTRYAQTNPSFQHLRHGLYLSQHVRLAISCRNPWSQT